MVIFNNKKSITSFKDLEVYQNTYEACIIVHKRILPKLPKEEKFGLYDQLSRSTKAIPRLIAEGYAKRHQRSGFQKYLDDAMGECNETVVGMEQIVDIYGIEIELCRKLVDIYDKSGRQLYKLANAWRQFKKDENRNRYTIRVS
ncbi:four helix bundle protein [Candidatus Woesebacteria bacterium RIFCSPHIGHO2_01_FULL_39_17]|uniref:Intervening sequence n=2 Tax=Candidatus Woeseibacteriota TaxID=1752722 RepID=A0A0G0NCI6_9BACT|nr:MAG: Intervening sequence [Microgenomates group bacterium GW2011_GWC1_38_12]KKR13188.1 MAG: Intervening sequence [Candidatus Woesebacteria bacterium GW2011_GWA1_39_21b]OGM24003.1 MAG: four helix bundle protein [Candidatus Woesebacteria bacterium RIFCSPHIGHO2_01_FULL_39_17]OGM65248.1 MAG: four helix bundle protein [Candidatus Woesebacteria bacterium RIFCSPLOWO2_01_FULL_39_14]